MQTFELYKNRNNKKEFIEYLRNSTECSKMDAESWDVLGKVTKSSKLINQFKDKVEENVCRALQEFYDDGVAEGEAKKIIENVNNLINNLGLSLEEACKAIGASIEDYEAAKKLLENSDVK